MEDGGLLFANAGAYKIVKRNPLSEEKNTFVGFIAHNAHISNDVDVVISWRGTITNDEWTQVMVTWPNKAGLPVQPELDSPSRMMTREEGQETLDTGCVNAAGC